MASQITTLIIKYIILFIIFGIIGWFIDSAYRSMRKKKWTTGTQFNYFSPLFAIGGMMVVLIYQFLEINVTSQILIAGTSITIYEFLSGIFCVKIMKRRYWDYSNNKYNLLGHTDLLRFFYWTILAALLKIILPLII